MSSWDCILKELRVLLSFDTWIRLAEGSLNRTVCPCKGFLFYGEIIGKRSNDSFTACAYYLSRASWKKLSSAFLTDCFTMTDYSDWVCSYEFSVPKFSLWTMIFMTGCYAFTLICIFGKLEVWFSCGFVSRVDYLSLIGILLLVSFPSDGYIKFITDLLPGGGWTSEVCVPRISSF